MKISILEYIGSVEKGILVLLSVIYDSKYYEATFFYTADDILLTISSELETEIGCKITEHKDYVDILKDILKKIVPYNEMINRVDPIDFHRWNPKNVVE
jgi:hypothetical protein